MELQSSDFNCVKPTIDPVLKFKNITVPDDGDFTLVSSKDFIAPIGSITLNMTDQAGNQANVVCNVQKPTKMPPVQLEKNDDIVLKASLSTFLVCSIDYEHIQQLWSILALYSDSPLKLNRDLLLTKVPYISYKYKQTENEDIFTNIEAEMRAEPSWLMQGHVSLQLDRTTTTLNTLHVQYSVDAEITLPLNASQREIQNWAMMLRVNGTRTEHTVLAGRSVELDCQALGDPPPVIEWVLPDGSKVRAPYVSEDGRIVIAKTGKFALHTADNFDTGVYHCIGTNYDDADILSFRITVIDPYMEHNYLNGRQLSAFLGETVFLPCRSTSVPDASLHWVSPEHVVLDHSSKNKIPLHNGTLKVQLTSERDGGYYKCIAANQYGVDFLVHQVIVEKNSNRSQKLDNHEEAAEGSGNGELDIITTTQSPPPSVQTQATSQASTEVLFTNRPMLKRINNYREVYKHNRDKMARRLRGHRRQFTPSTRRIDPLRWAAFLEKTKNIALPSKQENATMKPTVKVLLPSGISANESEMSGDIPPEEEFLLLVTKRPAMYTLGEVSGNVVTAEFGSIQGNFHSTAGYGTTTEAVVPLGSPVVAQSEASTNQESYTERMPEITRGALEAAHPPTTTMESLSPTFYRPSSTTDPLDAFPPGENDLHLKMKSTPPPTVQVTKTASPVTSHGFTKKPNFFVEATDKTSKKPSSQLSVVAVSAPDDAFGHIYVYSTQKITTPQLAAGSTIIAHQQIKIVRDTTPRIQLARRYNRRKKVSARRRIVRPDRIPNSGGRRFAFVRHRIAKESTALPPLVEINAPALTLPNKSLAHVTFQAPISTSFTVPHPEMTTVNPILTPSLRPGNKAVTAEASTAVPVYLESTQIVPQRQEKTSVPLQTVTDTYPSFSLLAETIDTPSVAVENTFTTSGTSHSDFKSVLPTDMSPSVSTGKSSWHVLNSFGSNYFQKELLEKQRRQLKSKKPLPQNREASFKTTEPIPTLTVLPVHVTAVSKQENQMDGLRKLNDPKSDIILEGRAPTPPVSVTELPSSASLSSFADHLNRGFQGPSIKPLLTTTIPAHPKATVSRIRVLRPGRRRTQRRKRPLRRFMHSQKNISAPSKGTAASLSLVTRKKVTEATPPMSTELLPGYTGTDVIATTLHPPVLHTTSIISGTSTVTPQLLARKTTTENGLSTKLPVYNGPSHKPTTAVPLTVSSLNVSGVTTVQPATSRLTLALVSTKGIQTVTVPYKESYRNAGEKPANKKPTTEASLPAEAELRFGTSTDAGIPTTQHPSQLTSQTVVTPVLQTTASPRWGGKLWHAPSPKIAESGNTFLVNTLTILNSPQSFTQHTPVWERKKNSYHRSWSEKTTDWETTTTNLVALESFHHARLAKPRIIGGKLAAFTVLASSDAFIPCEATGNPRPTIQWTKISSGTLPKFTLSIFSFT